MNKFEIQKTLSDLPLGGFLFFQNTKSTNDSAIEWALVGAPDYSLVYAEEQTHGRGRNSRSWVTQPGSALAFTVILRPQSGEDEHLQKFTALGALAVSEAVESLGLIPRIKWPNDVLLDGRKFCGILVETGWLDERARYIVLGIGVNVTPASIPDSGDLNFPATCLEVEGHMAYDRLWLLHEIVRNLIQWRPMVTSERFLAAWQNRLAFLGEMVVIRGETEEEKIGRVQGLEKDGSLRLKSPKGELFHVLAGEIHLHPLV